MDQFLLSIWFDKIPDKTIVWYGNDGNTVPRGAKVELNADLGLVLGDSQGKELWKPGNILSKVSYGFMNDTGNFVLVGSDSSKLWDSFSNPTDTLLPTQIMETGGVLYSRLSETNFTSGRFQLRLLGDGNLVLNTRDIHTNFAYAAYYISNTFDTLNASNSGYQVRINERGYMYILRRNGQRVDLTPSGVLPSSGYYHRATLNFDGVFVQYFHPKVFDGRPNWTDVWIQPDNICDAIGVGGLGSGACGFNSVCRPDDNRRPICECPKGYSLLDPDDKYGSCKPSFIQNCDYNGSSSAEDLYDFEELIQTDWPTSDFERLMPISESDCRRYCLEDCFCAVAIYRDDCCWKKKLPLSNGMKDKSVNGKALIKYMKRNLPPQSPGDCPIYREKKDQDTLIIVGSVLLSSSVFVNLMFVGAACFGFFCIYHKKTKKLQSTNTIVETNLRCFTYKELVEATNGFNEELGRGSFGIVYKGVIQMLSTNIIVAVKKLDKVVQDGDKEFKTEVNAIAQTHHKNLVRLLGFCEDGEHRLLVYEYMANGTLADFLFGVIKPSWKQRSSIALGIARGLAYLHEECSSQIIHCDIKPQNVLLDEYLNARISDFGLAKLLMINQSRTNTAIRGTKGYVAPEWFRNTPINVKVDVYSFGVLLLEIICCRRGLEDLETRGEKAILTDWAWDCFQEGRLDDLVENDEEAVLNELDKLERFVMVGIWCIQEDPSLRPSMRKVIQLLEGVVDVTKPPCPSPFSLSSS